MNSSTAVSGPQGSVKYVELHMNDGTKVGGRYVSDSAAFVTIVPMYILDEKGFMTKGSGDEVGIKTSLLTTMVTISDPTSLINTTLAIQNDNAIKQAAAEKKAADEKAAAYKIQAEQIAAEQAKYMPTKKA